MNNEPLLCQPRTVIYGMVGAQILAAILAMAPQVAVNRWVIFGLNSLLAQWIVLISIAALCWMQRRLTRVRFPTLLKLTPLVVIAVTCLACGLVLLFVPEPLMQLTGQPADFVLRCAGIALAIAVLGHLVLRSHNTSQELLTRAQEAELAALQARVRPHFLFNTLNTATALVHGHPDEAERVLLDLSDLFRAALKGAHDLPLTQELELVRRYLDIEALRFGDRMRVEWELPGTLPDVTVPALSLQPLVENAIKHGVEPAPDGGSVRIAIRENDGEVHIAIHNSLPPDAARTHAGHNIGLPSATARIERMTEGRGQVTAQQADGRFVVSVTLPMSSATARPPATR